MSETLVDLFARTVADFPDRRAVSDDHGGLTYAELDARANSIAHALAGHGVRGGDRVVIYRERGVDVFVSVLGVLKAGATYVAIDTRYPDSRRDLMIRACRAAAVVTEPGWRARLGPVDATVLEWRSGPGQEMAPPVPVEPGDPACVLFTSGSSGTPKAIVLEHRNLLYFARNPALPALVPADRVGQVSSLSFDAFHFEMWCGFAHGAEVVVLPTMAELVAKDLQRELRRRRITAMLAPTMALNHVVHEDRDAFAPLRVLLTGGDVVQPAACRELLAGSFSGEFVNLYGPAEGTTACTGYRVRAGEDGSVPIGTALAGATVRVLDLALREAPAGVVGELHISGAGVALGYSDQPALTAARFVPDPFGAPGERMYATGDLGRRREDGLLEFVGRADDQVKIRGFRVEPGEVERLLARHPSVLAVAVVAVGSDHDRRLVAVVAGPVSPRALREFAGEAMPDYQVPSAFVVVPGIPGDDHGKRDVRRIQELAGDHARRQAERVPPRDEVEHYLVTLWERLLGVEWVGPGDDFFSLGGNSMLAFRVHRRITRDLDVRLDVRDVLENGELAGLAEIIRTRGEEARRGHPVAGR
jgi:amino acid adenylation domain-containing protein